MIRLAHPEIGNEEIEAAAATLRSGQLVQGPRVADFEEALVRRLGAAHVVAVANGTAALHVALLALGVGPGDTVAVPTFSWPATANAVELAGATPLFIDIEPVTYGMDPDALDVALSTAKGLKAVMPVHAFGCMAAMRQISSVAERHGLPIIEDAACALGAAAEGKPAGCWGQLGCFSFHPRKAVTTGEGGAVVTGDAALARAMRALRNHGLDPASPTPDFIRPGFNYRLSEIHAAVGVAQLDRLATLVATRRALAARYDDLLAGMPVVAPPRRPTEEHVYQSYIVLLPETHAVGRHALIEQLRSEGIETTIGTYHIPMLRYYRERYGYTAGDFPTSERIAARALALPLHARLSVEDQVTVTRALGRLLSA